MRRDGMNPNDWYNYLNIEKELVTGFSIMFSRLEYCLKRMSEYVIESKNGVEADWDKFAADHQASFNPQRTERLEKAVEYLSKQPPLKQVLKNGVLDWKILEKQNLPLFQVLILSIRRVRNNLFHGGKFPSMPVEDPGRDNDLLESSITILQECLFLNSRVQVLFHQQG
jgi:hypothetical protein